MKRAILIIALGGAGLAGVCWLGRQSILSALGWHSADTNARADPATEELSAFRDGVYKKLAAGDISLGQASQHLLDFCVEAAPNYLHEVARTESGASMRERMARRVLRDFEAAATATPPTVDSRVRDKLRAQLEQWLPHCYDNSLRMLDLANRDSPATQPYRQRFLDLGLAPQDAVLVHGIATNPDTKHRYGHAWIEIGDTVLDLAHSMDEPNYLGKRDDYYRLGRIQPQECVRYSLPEALELEKRHRNVGPWHVLPADVK